MLLRDITDDLLGKLRVDISCVMCGKLVNVKVSTARYYIKRNGYDYVCHGCKVKLNSDSTAKKLKQAALDKGYNGDTVERVCCVGCNVEFFVKHKNVVANRRRNGGFYSCISCSQVRAHKDGKFGHVYNDEHKRKLKESSDKFWSENRGNWKEALVTKEFRQEMSECGKKAWTPEFRERMKELRNTDKFKKDLSKWSKMAWTPEFKLKMAEVRLNQPKTSSTQVVLYSLLKDLGVKFFDDCSPECMIGFYTFDCRIDPQDNIALKSPLFLEVQGDYWHSLPKTVSRDKAKATYLKEYFPEYDLKYLWEHEFNNKDRVVSLLRYWFGIAEPEVVDFGFDEVVSRIVDFKDAELFISKYHYAGRVGRSGLNIGFFVNDVLVAVCVFAYPVRQETAKKQGLKYNQVFELTRLAIHPSYQKKNFASFIIGKSIKLVKVDRPEVRRLVSFSDSTFNHCGIIYRASNWVLDGVVKSDYWYRDGDGYVCHKKTLWNKAKQMVMTEGEYCDKYGYVKVFGGEKRRFIYDLGGC